jgi:glycerol uptake facilitator-like aquaporin
MEKNMKTLQKFGGFAALYLAVAYLIGMALFFVVLDYSSMTDPAQRVAMLVDKQMVFFSTNLLMYVVFGVFLIVLSLALYDRLKSRAPATMQVATAIGIIWAGLLIASGMVSNAGIDPCRRALCPRPGPGCVDLAGN